MYQESVIDLLESVQEALLNVNQDGQETIVKVSFNNRFGVLLTLAKASLTCLQVSNVWVIVLF